MTNEELRTRYRLLKLVDEREVRTYHAENAAGHLVMVHFLPASAGAAARLLDLVNALNSVDRMQVVERLEVDGTQVLVTQYLQGFQTLRGWLESRPRKGSTPVPGEFSNVFGRLDASKHRGRVEGGEPPVSPPRPESAAGWTGMFGPGSAPPASKTPVSDPPPPRQPAPDPTPPRSGGPPSNKPVVRWRDQRHETSHNPPPATSEPPPVATPPAPPNRADGMTQLFGPAPGEPTDSLSAESLQRLPGPVTRDPGQGSEPPPPPLTPKPPVASRAADAVTSPGGFTGLFDDGRKAPDQSQPIPNSRDYVEALRAPVTPPPSRGSPPPVASGPTPPVPPPVQPHGEFTRLMSGMGSPPIAPASPASGPPPPPVSSAAPGGRSEFTRIISASEPPPAPPPAARAAPQEPPRAGTRRRRLVILLVALGAVALIAVLLTLVVVLLGTS